jgi:hypothetical protein
MTNSVSTFEYVAEHSFIVGLGLSSRRVVPSMRFDRLRLHALCIAVPSGYTFSDGTRRFDPAGSPWGPT